MSSKLTVAAFALLALMAGAAAPATAQSVDSNIGNDKARAAADKKAMSDDKAKLHNDQKSGDKAAAAQDRAQLKKDQANRKAANDDIVAQRKQLHQQKADEAKARKAAKKEQKDGQ